MDEMPGARFWVPMHPACAQYKTFISNTVVFTETWLNNSIHGSLLHWDNFQLVRLDRERIRDKKGGGVCIYVKSSISFEIVDNFSHLLKKNMEFIYLRIKPHMQKPINLLGIYRPPDGDCKVFLQHITDMIKQIDRSRSETIIIGDFNIDFNNKKVIASSKLNTLETKYALKQVIKANTRVTGTSSSCIYLLYTDISNISEYGVLNYDISDHFPIYGADWALARNLRNQLCMDIKTAKANTIKDKLDRYGPKPKRFWQEVNKLLPHSQDAGIRYLWNEITNNKMEDIGLNEYINDYFANIGSRLARECTPGVVVDRNNDMREARNGVNEVINFQRTPFTLEEVKKVCNEINIWKSASIPDVKTMVLKHAFLNNLERMLKIFNSSLGLSIFPSSWKLSTIVPLPKVQYETTASDLCPMALTPLPGKLLEKFICNRLQCWISDNNRLSAVQHGFRKGKSTITAIAALLDNLYKNINNNKNSYIIYLDLKKAFDTISYAKLLNKLYKLGMDGLTLAWFRSYLTERRQCVKLNNLTSDTLPITYGVPRGSILAQYCLVLI